MSDQKQKKYSCLPFEKKFIIFRNDLQIFATVVPRMNKKCSELKRKEVTESFSY